MLKINCQLFVLLAIFQSSFSQRRIKDGHNVESDKRYMVYLLSAPLAPVKYNGWLCGGSIITKDYVLTSAACVQDVQYMYVISGYNKYVPTHKIEENECLNKMKKKVILTCVPKFYEFDYNKTEMWARIDIAVVKVDTPFDFNDQTYETICSYTPRPIGFNIEKEFPRPGDDVITMGWGHTLRFRDERDTRDLNNKMLLYASTKILDQETCLTYFQENTELLEIIASSMLCTLKQGYLNDKGELSFKISPTAKGCITEKDKLKGVIGKMCEEENISEFYGSQTAGEHNYEMEHAVEVKPIIGKRRQMDEMYAEGEIVELEDEIEQTTKFDDLLESENYPGICQNDHGGPLVGWRGSHEVVVGVATLYKLNRKLECRGPYLFTKTWCNGAFLDCIINAPKNKTDARRCENPAEIGFEVIRRHISWVGHHDGPAANEQIHTRQQVPMSAFLP